MYRNEMHHRKKGTINRDGFDSDVTIETEESGLTRIIVIYSFISVPLSLDFCSSVTM